MVARESERIVDPVVSDQGGREMPGDPGDPVRKETVRRRAYELYERRGGKDGHALQDWLDAETQVGSELRHSLK